MTRHIKCALAWRAYWDNDKEILEPVRRTRELTNLQHWAEGGREGEVLLSEIGQQHLVVFQQAGGGVQQQWGVVETHIGYLQGTLQSKLWAPANPVYLLSTVFDLRE